MRGFEWALLGLLLGVFLPALRGMVGVWSSIDYASHGFLVPVVALWAALRERHRWPAGPSRIDPRGLGVLAAALLLYLLGLATGTLFLQGVALVGALAGAVLHARGLAWLRSLAFPLAFLLFMVPLPTPWITPAIVKLQLFVSVAAVAALHGLGVPVIRAGNVLEIPGGESLFVAEACSGVTSIITLVPLAVVLGRYTLGSFATRALLVVLVVPFAMLANLLRVLVLVLLAREWGAAQATQGPVHETTGLATYLLACGLLLGAGAWLRRGGAKRLFPPVASPR